VSELGIALNEAIKQGVLRVLLYPEDDVKVVAGEVKIVGLAGL
jgi:hypothetical protein